MQWVIPGQNLFPVSFTEDEYGKALVVMEELGWPCRLIEMPSYVKSLQASKDQKL